MLLQSVHWKLRRMDNATFQGLSETPAFAKWFWTPKGQGFNGDDIVKYINDHAKGTNLLRRQTLGQYVYAVVVNKPEIDIQTCVDGKSEMKRMKLMKVGFTQSDTTQSNKQNRMAIVKSDVKAQLQKSWPNVKVKCSVIFVLPINALDTRKPTDVEAEVRKKTGILLPQNIAKAMNLPVTTEWVVTTQAFIDIIRARIEEFKKPASKTTGLEPSVESLTLQDQHQSTPNTSYQQVSPSPGTSATKKPLSHERTPKSSKQKSKSLKADTKTVFEDKHSTFQVKVLSRGVTETLDSIKGYKDNEVNIRNETEDRFVLLQDKKQG